jgi:DNA-binding MarR family transcriptional regulator
MRTNPGGRKRLKLLVLLAAYADAEEPSPPARALAERLGIQISDLDRLLKRLQRDGYLTVAWRKGPNERNVYTLRLGDDERGVGTP